MSAGSATRREAFRQKMEKRSVGGYGRLADISLIGQQVHQERLAQIRAWGVQDHEPHVWLAILMEELGEVALEVNESRQNNTLLDIAKYRKELVQVAAVAQAAIEAIDHNQGG